MEIIFASIFAFITTNVDDIFILTLFFSNTGYQGKYIVTGQYLGIVTLVAVSMAGSLIGIVVDLQYIGLLGLLPIYLGIKAAIVLIRGGDEGDVESPATMRHKTANTFAQALFVAGVTIANGGDNISIYIPLFATLALSEKVIMVFIFLLMTAIWCLVAMYLSNHPFIKRSVERYAHIVTPLIFILLGIYILYESGTFNLFK